MRNFRVLQFFLLLGLCWIVIARSHSMRFPKSVSTEKEEKVKFFPEEECSTAGGICLERESCPLGKESRVGKCPRQSDSGAVCCHSLAKGERRCRNLGGSCMDFCSEILKKPQARDCQSHQFCCILT